MERYLVRQRLPRPIRRVEQLTEVNPATSRPLSQRTQQQAARRNAKWARVQEVKQLHGSGMRSSNHFVKGKEYYRDSSERNS